MREFKTTYWNKVEILEESALLEKWHELDFSDFSEADQLEIFMYRNCQFRPNKLLFGIDARTGEPMFHADWRNSFTFEENIMIVKWAVTPYTIDEIESFYEENILDDSEAFDENKVDFDELLDLFKEELDALEVDFEDLIEGV